MNWSKEAKITPILLSSEVLSQDFNHWLPFRNQFGVKVTEEKAKFPKSLPKYFYKIFLDFCKKFHIDSTQYKYYRVTKMFGCVWQVDYLLSTEVISSGFTIYNAYCNDKGNPIQYEIQLI